MKKQTTKLLKKAVCFCLAMVMVFGVTASVQAAKKSEATPANLVSEVKSSIGASKYPFSESNSVTSRRKVMGVKVADMDSYKAYCKTTSGDKQEEYILFIGKAKSSSKAKTAKKSLSKYISNESKSMKNYLSSDGKKLFKNVKYGTKGSWVWAVMIGSSTQNKNAVSAIKDKM